MNIVKGSLVFANAGRDKGDCFAVLEIDGNFAYIANGKERKVLKPKRKNIKHISATNCVINISELTNKKLKKLISEFLQKDLQEDEETAYHQS